MFSVFLDREMEEGTEFGVARSACRLIFLRILLWRALAAWRSRFLSEQPGIEDKRLGLADDDFLEIRMRRVYRSLPSLDPSAL